VGQKAAIGMTLREGTNKAAAFVATRPDWMLERFAKMPTTNFLFLLVAYATVRTTEHYVRSKDWTPSAEWLGFIIGLTGSSVFQWVKKRTTDHEYQRIQQGQSPEASSGASPGTTREG
jgi:hypothetical protein